MSNNYLISISVGVGSITTLYGAYSYYSAASAKQKEKGKKIMAVGVGILALGAASYFYSSRQVPDYLQPYVEKMKGRVVPEVKGTITNFPPYLSKFIHPDYVATEEGLLCKIPDELPPLEACSREWKPIVAQIKYTMPEQYAAGVDHSSRWGKGYTLGVNANKWFTRCNFGMDKSIVSNYKNALETAETTFLQDPNFESKSATQIVDSMKEIHKVLSKNIKYQAADENVLGGVLRTDSLIIGNDKVEFSLGGFRKYLEENDGTKADFVNIESYIRKMQQYGGIEAAEKFITSDEVTAMKKVVYFPPPPEEVPSAMVDYADKLKEVYSLVKNRIVHPVAGASWAHQRCGEVHAFVDGNGRLCRTMMNIVLQWGGIKGIGVPYDDPYTAAIKADQKLPGSFVNYLIDLIKWNNDQKVLSSYTNN